MTPEQEQRLETLEREMREHRHNGLDSQRVNLFSLFGKIEVVSVAPVGKPTDISGQLKIYTNGTTYRLYWYDTTAGAWRNVSTSGGVGGSDKQIQFNDSGVLAGNAGLTFDKADGGLLNLNASDSAASAGGDAYLFGGYGGGNGAGGAVHIGGHDGSGSGTGGVATVAAGNGGATGNGGSVSIAAGLAGGGNGDGGSVTITSGSKAGSGTAGAINLVPSVTLGGDVRINSGAAVATNTPGGFLVIPVCAGTPTGTPAKNGSMIYDTSNNKLYVYNGAWKSVTLA